MPDHSYSRPDAVHGVAWTYGDEDDGCACIRVRGSNTLRGPGVALCFSAIIDCTPVKEYPTPPLTIKFVKNEPDGASGSNTSPTRVAEFTRDSGDFVLIRRTRDFEAMVAAAGFPAECAPVVEDFCLLSATNATNSFKRSMAITVEMGPLGSHINNDRDDDDEDGEECPICMEEFVVGSAEAAQLSCSHAFHRTCLDKWVSKKRTCPYCRTPVPQGVEILPYEDYPEPDEDDNSGEHPPLHGAS